MSLVSTLKKLFAEPRDIWNYKVLAFYFALFIAILFIYQHKGLIEIDRYSEPVSFGECSYGETTTTYGKLFVPGTGIVIGFAHPAFRHFLFPCFLALMCIVYPRVASLTLTGFSASLLAYTLSFKKLTLVPYATSQTMMLDVYPIVRPVSEMILLALCFFALIAPFVYFKRRNIKSGPSSKENKWLPLSFHLPSIISLAISAYLLMQLDLPPRYCKLCLLAP